MIKHSKEASNSLVRWSPVLCALSVHKSNLCDDPVSGPVCVRDSGSWCPRRWGRGLARPLQLQSFLNMDMFLPPTLDSPNSLLTRTVHRTGARSPGSRTRKHGAARGQALPSSFLPMRSRRPGGRASRGQQGPAASSSSRSNLGFGGVVNTPFFIYLLLTPPRGKTTSVCFAVFSLFG